MLIQQLLRFFFPPKCAFCKQLLEKEETDLCHHCRKNAPVFPSEKNRFSFLARWTSVWYYKDDVRNSLLRFKFGRYRSYSAFYGRQLALRLIDCQMDTFDLLTWIPISGRRRFRRGFDQAQLLAEALGQELGVQPVRLLKRVRHTPPQSRLKSPELRRANISGAYTVTDFDAIAGKRILLVDDILTTGSTALECARTLLSAGAGEVWCAVMASAGRSPKK